jgi:chromate transporter
VAQSGASLLFLFLFFLKVGAVLYGTGYVLVAFLEGDLVETHGLLSRQQLLDAIAAGQLTPGPILSTATFIGYQLHGWAGALVATLGIFLPSFVLVAVFGPLFSRLRKSPRAESFLAAVRVAAVALIAAVLLKIGKETLLDWRAALIALAAAVAAIRFKWGAVRLVAGGALAGWALT